VTVVESARSFWRQASPIKRGLLATASVALIAAIAVAVVFTASAGGDDGEPQAAAGPTDTPAPTATSTLTVEQVLRYFAAVAPTPTPERAVADGAVARNPTTGAPPAASYVPPRAVGTGPGPITGTDMSISIPAIGVNASVYARTVGTNGQMGNPAGAWDVIWYDFSQNWAGLGGYPGTGISNAVYAGHVDYIRVGPAVFWSVRNLVPGDLIHVNSANGTITYSVQWSQWAGPNDDFTQFVSQTGSDVITLVTCIGGFSAGHYSNRLIVRGVKV
jgi:LPXTG-site transpeptidase (sortase) family protein